jgi:hypothetical protein
MVTAGVSRALVTSSAIVEEARDRGVARALNSSQQVEERTKIGRD